MGAWRATAGLMVASVMGACGGGDAIPPPETFFEIDSGQSAALAEGGRTVVSSWHGDTDRQQQILCVEPPEALGEAAWARFETCLHYLNGLIDLDTYRDRISGTTEP